MTGLAVILIGFGWFLTAAWAVLAHERAAALAAENDRLRGHR